MSRLGRRLLAAGAVFLLVAAAFAAGVFVDQVYPDQVPPLFLGGGSRSQLDQAELNQALRIVQADYYGRPLDYRALSHGTIRGLVQALGDPYSTYLDPSQYQAQRRNLQGSHTGMIGISVNFQDPYPVIAGILPGSPAQHSGLETGDAIVKVNGQDARGLTAEQASALIRGPSGTHVVLTVRRGTHEMDVDLERLDFTSPSVVSLELEGGVLYVRVYQFDANTSSELDQQLRQGLPGSRGVVLDLRDDPGGLVDAATHTISDFVSSGEAFEQRDGHGHVDRTDVGGQPLAPSLPLVVLVNGNSASASEITAGSLQARGRARLVGTKTFGKGSVQLDFPLQDGGDLHLTIKHWFLPGGRTVDKVGLTPDVTVALASPADMFDAVQPARGHAADDQLNRALALLAAG